MPLRQRKAITPADLIGEKLILPARLAVKNQLENWFGKYMEDIHTVGTHNLSSYNKQISVRHGMGLAMGTYFETTFPELCMRPVKPAIESGNVVVWKRTQAMTPYCGVSLRPCKRPSLARRRQQWIQT